MGKVICPGELLIDFVCTDHDESLVTGQHFLKKAGGAPANVAVAIQKLGARAYMLGSVGNDQFGVFLEETLSKYEVDTTYLYQLDNAYTTLAFVSLTSSGERDFKFNRGADELFNKALISDELLKEADVFHFGSATAFLGGDLYDTYTYILNEGVKMNKIITFDPNFRDALFGDKIDLFVERSISFIKQSDIVKVSDEEATLITGVEDERLAAKKICQMGAKYVLLTLGSKGTLLVSEKSEHLIESIEVDMVDATGAGDAFIGAVIARIANSLDLSEEAMIENVKFGNYVGAKTVEKYGALDSIPYLHEIE